MTAALLRCSWLAAVAHYSLGLFQMTTTMPDFNRLLKIASRMENLSMFTFRSIYCTRLCALWRMAPPMRNIKCASCANAFDTIPFSRRSVDGVSTETPPRQESSSINFRHEAIAEGEKSNYAHWSWPRTQTRTSRRKGNRCRRDGTGSQNWRAARLMSSRMSQRPEVTGFIVF